MPRNASLMRSTHVIDRAQLIKELEVQIRNETEAAAKLREQVVRCETTLQTQEALIRETEIKIQELFDAEQEYGDYKALAQCYQDIPAVLLTETVPWIEHKANEILQAIAPNLNLQI